MTAMADVEIEAALIGAMLVDGQIAKSVRAIVNADHFYAEAHAAIFRAICDTIDAGKLATPVTLRPLLENETTLAELGGLKYLAKLSAVPDGLLAWAGYAEAVADMSARRRAMDALKRPDVSLEAVAADLSIHLGTTGSARRLPVINFADWNGPPPPRRSMWGDWIPLHQTTLLAGDGGVGKSLLAQHLATSVAVGADCLGKSTMCRPALYVTAEDDPDELHRRQIAICDAIGCTPLALAGRLHLASLAGDEHTALARVAPDGRMSATDRWRGVVSLARQAEVGLIVIDNATAAFAGDHNDLHTVARFLALLTGLAIERDGAVVLLHHPNKGGAEWLGSVAWHNQVRSRLQVRRPEGTDPDARLIESSKANYGRTGERIDFRWYEGAFVREDDLPASAQAQLDEISGANAADEAFLRVLDACTARNINVSHSGTSNFAPLIFTEQPEGKGWTKEQFKKAMFRLAAQGIIEFDMPLWKGADRHPRKGIRRKQASA